MVSTAAERTRLSDRLDNHGVTNARLAGEFPGETAATAQAATDNLIGRTVTELLAGRLDAIEQLLPDSSPAALDARREAWQRFRERQRAGQAAVGVGAGE
jgi:hypothetical protein